MELKCSGSDRVNLNNSSSNRTFMELKSLREVSKQIRVGF